MTGSRIQTSKSSSNILPILALIWLRMMTVDIQRFSNHLAAIYSNLAKPILDVILYNYQLSRNVGAEGLVLLTLLIQGSAAMRELFLILSYFPITRLLVRAVTPAFGSYAAEEAALTGALRHSHSRLMESAEEVAFFSGEEIERMLIERDYFELIKHVNRTLRIRLWHGIAEEGIIKYVGLKRFCEDTYSLMIDGYGGASE